jgi:hypothetical protein
MMRHVPFFMVFALLAVSPSPVQADLKKALAEPDLEKRSGLALDNASTVFKATRSAYQDGDAAKLNSGIAEIQESVELASTSLAQTGKNPRKSPKWFKRAEIATRDLLRRLDSFQNEMAFDDRPRLDALKTKVQQVHEDLLVGLMEGKRK